MVESATVLAQVDDMENTLSPNQRLAALSEHQDAAFALAARVAGNTPDAEDIVQDAYLRAAQSRADIPAGADSGAWFMKVIINTARDRRSSEKSRHSRERKAAAMLATREVVDATTLRDDAEFQQTLHATLQQLDEKFRLTLCLHYEQGRPHAEVAAILGIPHATVRTHASRGLDELRDRLSSAGYAITPPALIAFFALGSQLKASAALSTAVAAALSGTQTAARWRAGLWPALIIGALILGAGIAVVGSRGNTTPVVAGEGKTAPETAKPAAPVKGRLYIERTVALGNQAQEIPKIGEAEKLTFFEYFYTAKGALTKETAGGKLARVMYEGSDTSWSWDAEHPDHPGRDWLITGSDTARPMGHGDGAKYIARKKQEYRWDDEGEVVWQGHKCRLLKFGDAVKPRKNVGYPKVQVWFDEKADLVRREMMTTVDGRQQETLLTNETEVPAKAFKAGTYKTANAIINTIAEVRAADLKRTIDTAATMDKQGRQQYLEYYEIENKPYYEQILKGLKAKGIKD